jgi:hypothetical protein
MGSDRALQKVARRLFRAKQERRRELAALPFEEKIRIVSDMQALAKEIAGMRRRLKRYSKPKYGKTKRSGY